MGVLSPIILPKPAGSMQVPQIQLIQTRTVRREAVRRDRLRLDGLVVQEPPEQPQRRLRIAPTLDQDVEDLAFIVDRAP